MKNKEKYAKEIVDAVTSGGYGFGFNKSSGEIRRCNEVTCDECLFCELCFCQMVNYCISVPVC